MKVGADKIGSIAEGLGNAIDSAIQRDAAERDGCPGPGQGRAGLIDMSLLGAIWRGSAADIERNSITALRQSYFPYEAVLSVLNKLFGNGGR